MARLNLTPEKFKKLYFECAEAYATTGDPIIDAIANECFGGPRPRNDYDVLDRFFCIHSDLETFAQKLLDSDFNKKAQEGEDRRARREAERNAKAVR